MKTLADQHSYKYLWAQRVAQVNLEKDFDIVNKKLSSIQKLPPAQNLTELVRREGVPLFGDAPATHGKFNVGIVGGGCAGLFTGMILDYLRSEIDGIDITYDILEATDKKRLGGRLYTHRFSEGKHDYYDVGAMRFPKNPIMDRTFRLFKQLDLEKHLVPYYFDDDINKCPSYFGDVRHIGKPSGLDPYNINAGLPKDKRIPEWILKKGPDAIMDDVIGPYKDMIRKGLDRLQGGEEVDYDWTPLRKADFMSTRQFLRSKENPKTGFNFNTIEWLETFVDSTGAFNQALSETVLDSLDFESGDGWYCLEGGAQQIAVAMEGKVVHKPEYLREVTAITADANKISLRIKHRDTNEQETRDYFAVFNSTTLGALQRMDISKAGLRYGTKQAIRSLSYGASCKVGMKFKKAWWMQAPHNINKGGMGKTDLPLRVCVYPSYNIHDDPEDPAVLLCSYTWTQDAQRMGSLIAAGDDALKAVLFHDLALLHATDTEPYEEVLAKIESLYIEHHAYDWYADPYAAGAFALFGPGQFSHMWPEIIKPNGWLFLIGEAASAHHAWIVGALESAVRGVLQMLQALHLQEPGFTPYKTAIELLEDGNSPLPFGGRPKEMPKFQKGAQAGVDHVEDGQELEFMAAQVIIGFMDLLVEQAS